MTEQRGGPAAESAERRRALLLAAEHDARVHERSEYVASQAYDHAAGCGAVVVALVAGLGLSGLSLYVPVWRWHAPLTPTDTASVATVIVVLALIAGGSVWVVIRSLRRAAAAPYVPPVQPWIVAPQTNDVLLRASEQPSASAAELVRAARSLDEEAPDELLRPDRDAVENRSR